MCHYVNERKCTFRHQNALKIVWQPGYVDGPAGSASLQRSTDSLAGLTGGGKGKKREGEVEWKGWKGRSPRGDFDKSAPMILIIL